MDSRELGNDLCLAWPTAEIAVMGAEAGIDIIGRRELGAIEDPDARALRRIQLEADFTTQHLTPDAAMERGYVDEVIDPTATRSHLVAALARIAGKRERLPHRKHSNVPL
jgi:propionyl-CoA carboxylase beta chain